MKRMRTGSGPALILLLCVIAGAAVLSGCEKDSTTGPGTSGGDPAEELIATQAQAGLWEWNMVLKDCTTQEVVQQGSYSDTLCVGESVNPESEGAPTPSPRGSAR